jgi:hypothetical protein
VSATGATEINHAAYNSTAVLWIITGTVASGNIVGLGTMLKTGRSLVRFPMRSLDFCPNFGNPSNRTMALRLTQPVTEMSTRNISWW